MSYKKLPLLFCLGIFLSAGRNANAQSQTFNYTGAVQSWTVPCATSITINCFGAQGGSANNNAALGGLGAQMEGTFAVTPGQVLTVIVGGQGVSAAANLGSGGGSGSGVVYNGTPWIIAGGGAGRNGGGYANANATTSNNGQPGSGDANGGMAGSDGGSIVYCAPNDTAYGGKGFNSGNKGSMGNNGHSVSPCLTTATNGAWGLGGGGGGVGGGYCNCGGGGGGYSGGGGGGINGDGGGGGSYNIGTNQNNVAGVQSGNGQIIITWVNANIPLTNTGVVYQNEATCNGQSGIAYAKVTGVGLSYSWAPVGGTRDTATGLSAGNYTVTVVSSCGFTATSSVTITQPANVISVTTTVNNNVLCNGGNNGSAMANVSGVGAPYTYTWSPVGGNAATANGLTAGIYTVKVVNACGATASATAIVTQPASLTITASTTANITCYGNSNGSVFGQVGFNSGTPPYRYTWSPIGVNSDTAIGLAAGTYTINLIDANGCTGSSKTTITQPNVLTVLASTQNNALCNGLKTGSTVSTVNGGTMPYTYTWTGGQTSSFATALGAGTYAVNVTDAHGCTTSAQTTITQPTPLKVATNTTLDSGSCTGSAWVVVTGGVVPYVYSWTNGSTSYYIPDQCGTKQYCCRISDAQGCKDTECVEIVNVTGVNNIAAASAGKVTVYPNPTSGQFTIELSGISNQWSVEVYNVLGEKVYSQAGITNATSNINLGNQPNGVYVYRIVSSTNGNMIGQGKIVLEK